MKTAKRRVISNLVYSWLIFIGLVILIIIEQGLASPWDRVTTAIWILGVVAFVFFVVRGFYSLSKYFSSMRSGNEG